MAQTRARNAEYHREWRRRNRERLRPLEAARTRADRSWAAANLPPEQARLYRREKRQLER
jgi:hypothetical protein